MRKLLSGGGVFIIIAFSSCKKNELAPTIVKENLTLISQAKNYFDQNILSGNLHFNTDGGETPNPRQLLNKTPVWENAYTGETPEKNQVVIVPLKFDKHLTIKSNSPTEKDYSLNKQSHLFIYKNKSGYHAEVVTAFPDNSLSKPGTKTFSGVVRIEDWAGNKLHSYLYKNGDIYDGVPDAPHKTQKGGNLEEDYCYYRNIYYCSVDTYGNPYDCTFSYTEWIGCYFEQKYDRFYDEIGAGEYSFDELVLSTPVNWVVAEPVSHFWYVKSYETLKGIKVANETWGGHFIENTHGNSTVFNALNGGYATWQELQASSTVSAAITTTTISGKVSFNNSAPDVEVNNKSNAWPFYTAFP